METNFQVQKYFHFVSHSISVHDLEQTLFRSIDFDMMLFLKFQPNFLSKNQIFTDVHKISVGSFFTLFVF